MRSGWIGPGPRVAEFEREFAARTGSNFAISTGTGTAALQTALAALGLGRGDEVILPSFTWVSIFQVVLNLGATPVFADVEPEYLTMDPECVRQLITARTRGIICVHHGGQLADVASLREIAADHGIWLVDDAAHACGASWNGTPVGSLCDVTCFSFNAMKNLAIGDGGMVTVRDQELARKIATHRSLGLDRDTYARYGRAVENPNRASWDYDVVSEGLRNHMNDIAAACGLVQLSRLTELNGKRAALVARYEEHLADLSGARPVRARPGTSPSNHMYTVRLRNRTRFISEMSLQGVSIGVHYKPIHHFSLAKPYYRHLPVTDEVWQEVTTFPLFTTMTEAEQTHVTSAARVALLADR
ncbi:MAG: DegT/DnrJ/EryC1/StrS family aminotransferase [Bryobacterales bacterium]|nr:DegT/DnrJ/EryC1/StrS family aminotransferase [Bryobacterales bacterium]